MICFHVGVQSTVAQTSGTVVFGCLAPAVPQAQ